MKKGTERLPLSLEQLVRDFARRRFRLPYSAVEEFLHIFSTRWEYEKREALEGAEESFNRQLFEATEEMRQGIVDRDETLAMKDSQISRLAEFTEWLMPKAMIDHDLTQLWRPLFFTTNLVKALRTAVLPAWLAVVFVDVRRFKRYNDELSYAMGNRVLLRIADIFRHNVRMVDFPCRWGGDEFVCFMLDLAPEQSEEVAQRFKDAVTAFDWAQVDSVLATADYRPMVDVGVVYFHISHEELRQALAVLIEESTPTDEETLLMKASKLMRKAKLEQSVRVVTRKLVLEGRVPVEDEKLG